MTKKLFYTYPTCTNWTARVTNIIEKEDYFLITLDETAFYPEGGGQPADQGFINQLEVLDVIEEENEIYHKLASKPDTPEVSCEIDWNLRFDHSQQHTGQHLLSASIIERFGYVTKSFHLGTDNVTIDIETTQLSETDIIEIEQRVNQYIYQNREIKTYFVTEEELSSLPLRKVPEVTDDIRIVEIDGIDVSACCGTHVNHTGQLGMIRIVKTEKQKGMVRVYFKCGYRALVDYQQSGSILNKISSHLSSNRESVLAKIEKLEAENKSFQKEMEGLKEEMDQHFAQELVNKTTSNVISFTFNNRTLKDMQRLARLVIEQNYLVIFQSELEKKLFIAHNGSFDFHPGQFLKDHVKNFQGKGGGNATSAQASFETNDDMARLSTHIENNIKSKTL
ncbi:alanyl-tRNA editing protein [Bacillus sp. PS06]|uniref:alanyl-tRNA editing protein n=1 Tax=Bacillus sp. PS06 TaxID=2764176 RepID=UPI00177B04DA|nr:alanine--tRNA ligase-related protein [Bacillus sp. PS06]MBD8071268.1 alanyl-tRNA editing protein [Bacillus sp. PS06]